MLKFAWLTLTIFVGSVVGGAIVSRLFVENESPEPAPVAARSTENRIHFPAPPPAPAVPRAVPAPAEPVRAIADHTHTQPSAQVEDVPVEQIQERFEDRLALEGADAAWSHVSERAAIDAVASVDDAAVDFVDCRSSLCVARFIHGDPAASHTLFDGFRSSDETGGPAFVRRQPLPGGRFSTTVYFARPGAELEPAETL